MDGIAASFDNRIYLIETIRMPHGKQPDDPLNPAVRRSTAVLSLALAIALAIGLIAATGLRWLTQRTPSSVLAVHADASMQGGEVILTGPTSNHERRAALNEQAGYVTPLFLEPGFYTIRVEQSGRTAFNDSMYVASGQRYDINVAPTTQPTTMP